ncbi:MAG: hypothetical protein ACHQ0I_03750 [Candidatus Lutacidiplasmatales archaeon]
MPETDPCQLHEVALFTGPEEPEILLGLARSPIGDECRTCTVCRLAREYVERRLDETAGRDFPPEQSAEAAWRRLQAAYENTKTTVHRTQ